MSALRLHTTRRGDHLVVRVYGPVTGRTAADLRDLLRQVATTPDRAALEIDLTCCTEADVDGLLALDVARHAARRHGRALTLVSVPPLIERLLHHYRLDHLLAATQPTPQVETGSLDVADEDAADEAILVRTDAGHGTTVVIGADADEESATAGTTSRLRVVPTLEADPADVTEQHIEVPVDEDETDES